MLSVGIHENLVITKTTKNDKGSLVIGVKQTGGSTNFLDNFNSEGASSLEQKEQDFLIFPPRLQNNATGATDTQENLLKKIAEVRDPLDAILKQYTTSNNIKWDIFANTGLTNENSATELPTERVLTKIYDNIVNYFIKQMQPFVGENGKKMRMIFVRQSAAKHYPKLRTKFLSGNPFIEPMTVPREASRLRFSKYEIEKGLNVPDAVSGEQTVSVAEANQAEALFSK